MQVGLFFQVPITAPQTAQQRLRETIEQVCHADRLGFDTVWLAEGHFRPIFSVVPSPLLLAATLAGLTSRIRLGTASIILPLHDPLRVAEEAALVDVLSGGRLDLGLGRGAVPPLPATFGQDWATRDDRFLEGLEIIERVWPGEPAAFSGAHYRFDTMALTPRPLQQPPALHITANHPDMATFTGARGLGLLMGAANHPLPDAFFAHLDRYHAAFRPAPGGQPRPRTGAVFWVFPGPDLADVRRRIEPSLLNNHIGVRHGFETIARTFGVFGSPAECADALGAIQARAHLDELICHFNPGGLVPHVQVLDAMSIFAETVRPAITG